MKRVALLALVFGLAWALVLPILLTGSLVPPNRDSLIAALVVVVWSGLWLLPMARRRWAELGILQWLTCVLAVFVMFSLYEAVAGTWLLRLVAAAIYGTIAFVAWMLPVGLINSFVEPSQRPSD